MAETKALVACEPEALETLRACRKIRGVRRNLVRLRRDEALASVAVPKALAASDDDELRVVGRHVFNVMIV